MSEKDTPLEIRIRFNFPTILGIVTLFHILFFFFGPMKFLKKDIANSSMFAGADNKENRPIPINFINMPKVRTVGVKNSKSLNDTYLNSTKSTTREVAPVLSEKGIPSKTAPVAGVQKIKKGQGKARVDLSDLAAMPGKIVQNKIKERNNNEIAPQKTIRPGTMPIVGQKKAIDAISLRGNGIKQFAQTNGQGGRDSKSYNVSGGESISSFQNTDVGVNLEVPEGVNPDELNEYEQMFYSFQRRVALSYVNSFMSHYNKFERINPGTRFPMTDSKETMTGRLTYDAQGNIKQIKMVRWTNVSKLQDFFLEVVKGMDSIQNPPKTLWEKDGEFTVFFTLVVNPNAM